MANYYGTGRTNYVRLRDEACYARFAQLCALCEARVEYQDDDPATGLVAAFCAQDDGLGDFTGWVTAEQARASGYPFAMGEVADLLYESAAPAKDEEEVQQIDFLGEAARLLAPGQVLVFQHVGAEALRFVSGYAVALNHTGERLYLELNQIYDLAAQTFGLAADDISRAEY